jgi:glucans biosynthesis protein C
MEDVSHRGHSAAVDSQVRTERLIFVDVLRVSIIVFVIFHHAAQAYGPTGGAWPVHDRAHSDWFRPFYTVNSAFGLGLLFLLAGYFVPRSYERKGPRRFLKERWARIGVPLVVFVLMIHLPLAYLFKSRPEPAEFIRWLYENGWQPLYLHLWFLCHILLYSAVYVLWRELAVGSEKTPSKWRPPSHAAMIWFVVALASITWIFRVSYPVDKWAPLLWVVPSEPAHLPQYVLLFAAGVAAYRGDWLRRIKTSVGIIWLGIGVTASAGIYVAHAVGEWNDVMGAGGLNWSSLVRSAWETVICAGLSVGLIVLCRQVFHRRYRLLAAMATASFAAYILHLAIVIALQAEIAGLALPAIVKFALVAATATVLAFGIAHLSSKVPGLRDLLGTPSAGTRSTGLSGTAG